MRNPILESWAAVRDREGDRPAVLEPCGAVARSFAAIGAESDAAARHLDGLPAGSVVSLCAPNRAAWPALVLGIWKAGCCVLLADRSLPSPAIDDAERRCGARARLSIDGDGTWSVAKLPHEDANLDGLRPDLIKLTSGTTGEPRPLLLSAGQLAADCDNICRTMAIGPDDLNYGVVAFSHSYGFSNLVTPLLRHGVPLVAAADALPRAIVEGIRRTGATVLPSAPAVFQALSGIDGAMPALRLCISAGAPLTAGVAQRFRERFGRKVHSFYGASECGAICYDATDAEVDADGFVGTPVSGVELLQGTGNATEGWSGQVRSAAVCLSDMGGGLVRAGVFHPPDRIAPHQDGWRIVGRENDIINVAGRKVNPMDVERALLGHPAIAEAAVFGVPDNARGETVVAWVVSPRGTVDTTDLLRHCTSLLGPWQMPREIRCVESLPVTARGKISRRELRAAHLQSRIPSGSPEK